jgi:hypothetical protein
MKNLFFLVMLSTFSVAQAYELDACIDYCYDTIEEQEHLKYCVKKCAEEFPVRSFDKEVTKNFCETYEECDDERDSHFPLF